MESKKKTKLQGIELLTDSQDCSEEQNACAPGCCSPTESCNPD